MAAHIAATTTRALTVAGTLLLAACSSGDSSDEPGSGGSGTGAGSGSGGDGNGASMGGSGNGVWRQLNSEQSRV